VSKSVNGISILVPCYNEQGAIAATVEAVHAAMRDTGDFAYEVIVIDDGSTDQSAEMINASQCRLIRLPVNRGYGAALKTGARQATHDLLAIIDADGTYPADRLVDMARELGEAEMIVGARVGVGVEVPLARRPAKWTLTALAKYLTDTPIPDLNSGLRVVRRDLWRCYERYLPDGFSLTTTITLAALTNGHEVKYKPIEYRRRVGRSKIRPIRDTIEFVKLILRTVLYFDPMKIFVPLSLLLFAAGAMIGVGSLIVSKWFGLGQFMDVTTVVLFLSGMQMLAIGALADLITKRIG